MKGHEKEASPKSIGYVFREFRCLRFCLPFSTFAHALAAFGRSRERRFCALSDSVERRSPPIVRPAGCSAFEYVRPHKECRRASCMPKAAPRRRRQVVEMKDLVPKGWTRTLNPVSLSSHAIQDFLAGSRASTVHLVSVNQTVAVRIPYVVSLERSIASGQN